MRRLLSILIVLFAAGAVLGGSAHRMSGPDPRPAAPARADGPGRTDGTKQPEQSMQPIDYKADLIGPVAPGDSVIFFVGNFAAQHNGAVITCDSAVRYSDQFWEFFGNVLINKNTTYVYGDRGEYNGNVNEASVYSEIIKVVDGDATLYTYHFRYNTVSNVGEFYDGGVLLNGENRLESKRGYYYGDEKRLVAVDEVQMRNEEYELKGDSVIYDMTTDNAYFFDRTNLWNRDGEYLYADRGEYRKADSLYVITRNGYLLTEKQELWSDSIDYFRPQGHVVLRRDLQIDDTEHKVLAFGDYGEYWQDPGNAFLTRRPAVISYDTSQGDSVYMRSDSIFLHTIRCGEEEARAAAEAVGQPDAGEHAAGDGASGEAGETTSPRQPVRRPTPEGGLPDGDPFEQMERRAAAQASSGERADSLAEAERPDSLAGAQERPDTLRGGIDSVAVNPLDTLTGAERKAYLKEQARKAAARRKAEARKAKKVLLDSIAARRRVKQNAKLAAQEARDKARTETLRQKAIRKLRQRREKALRRGKVFYAMDPKELARLDAAMEPMIGRIDSMTGRVLDSLLAIVQQRTEAADSLDTVQRDSLYRIVKGFRNVKIYRTDFQVVCDSLTAISSDSTIHLHIQPVLWNENNQITADSVTAYTFRQQIVRAEFFGSPIMSSEIDTTYYNQVTGKSMTAFFRNNQLYRNDVNGNAQTLYFMTDGEPPAVTTMGVIESGDLSFFFEDKELHQMTWRANPDWKFYPVYPDYQVPADQPLRLQKFHWEGSRRPTRSEVFDRTIRPSQRAEREQLPHPDFPILRRLEAQKQRLIERRQWAERSETVDPATAEWMHDLGYEPGAPRPSQRPAAPSAPEPAEPSGTIEPTAPAEAEEPTEAEKPAAAPKAAAEAEERLRPEPDTLTR